MPNERANEEPDQDAFAGPAEEWESWETTLVVMSLAIGVVGLVLLGFLVDRFILP